MNGKDFLGTGLKFPLQVDPRSGKLSTVSGEEDIAEAIEIILRTVQGERVMHPEFGTNIVDYLFAPTNSTTRHSLAHHIQEAVSMQELRIYDVDVSCEEIDSNTGALQVNIAYTVRSTNNRFNHVYPFFLTEGNEGGAS